MVVKGVNEQGIKTRLKILHLNRWITKVDASDTIVYDDDDDDVVDDYDDDDDDDDDHYQVDDDKQLSHV